jgi:antitoxin YefM
MEVINYSEFRKNIKEVLDKTVEDHEAVVISRGQNRDVVLLSLNDYNSWMETMYLMKSNRNYTRITAALARVEANNFQSFDLIEE